jgi:hypothetical protein
MPAASDWKVPSAIQPRARDYAYDLDRALAAVVGVKRRLGYGAPGHADSVAGVGLHAA